MLSWTGVSLASTPRQRRCSDWLRHLQTFSRPDCAAWVQGDFVPEPLFGNDAMDFGQLSRSSAVIGAGADLPSAASPHVWAGQPGTRAPHVEIHRQGQSLSTLDLFGRGFVLLAAVPGWRTAASALPLHTVIVGEDVLFPTADAFATHFGVGPAGAALIRPDGIVAWRSDGGADRLSLSEAIARAACATAEGLLQRQPHGSNASQGHFLA